MSRIVVVASAFSIIGLIFGLNIHQPDTEHSAKPNNDQVNRVIDDLLAVNRNLLSRISQLETQQIDERNSRLLLSTAIDTLKSEFEDNQSSLHAVIANESSSTIEKPTLIPSVDSFEKNKTQILTALGIDETVTVRIQEREEKLEMDRLYLRNTAIREGWFGTEKYFEKTQDISVTTNIYREELGDDSYDRYLFDSNQSNRISVLSVISNSPAEEAGIEEGDIISQYDNEAIFSWSDLTKATTNGEIGQQVSIIVQRDNIEFEFFVPRGPLGIRLENIKMNPNS